MVQRLFKSTVNGHIRGTLDKLLGQSNDYFLLIFGVHFWIALWTILENFKQFVF